MKIPRLFLIVMSLLIMINAVSATMFSVKMSVALCFIGLAILGAAVFYSRPPHRVRDCSREENHDGPCNGWPCDPVKKQLWVDKLYDAMTHQGKHRTSKENVQDVVNALMKLEVKS